GWRGGGWRRRDWVARAAGEARVPELIRRSGKAIQRLGVHGARGAVLADLAGGWLIESAIEHHRLLTAEQLQALRGERGRARESREVAHRLWSVLSLECWARHFLSGRPSRAVAAAMVPHD